MFRFALGIVVGLYAISWLAKNDIELDVESLAGTVAEFVDENKHVVEDVVDSLKN